MRGREAAASRMAYLLARAVGALTSLLVVVGTMEGHECVPFAFGVIHLVALFNFDSMHLDGTAKLGGHEDFGTDHLA